MTSNITPTTNASSDGADPGAVSKRHPREHGLAVVRDREAKALIGLGTDALSEAFHLGHELHGAIYDKQPSASNAQLRQTLAEALTCMERAEHYLLMLGSVFEEHPARNGPPAAVLE